MTFHPNFFQLGKLSIVETYEFYDKPLLFSCKNTIGTLYLAVSADETSISETWVYVPISQKRLDQIRAGVIDLHDAFTQAEDDLAYLVITPIDENAQVTIEQIAAQSLSDDMLPLKGERLRLPTASLPPMATKDELSIRASQMLRDQISLKLRLPDSQLTEAPAELLGEVLQRFQRLLNSISASIRNNQKKSGPNLLPQLNVVGFASGSFAVELVSNHLANLFGESEVGIAVEQYCELIRIGSDPDTLKAKLSQLKPNVAVNYALFLKAIEQRVSDTTVVWASPQQGKSQTASITSGQAVETIAIIEKTDLQPPEKLRVIGTLIGANLRSRIFEISATDGNKRRKYTGRIPDMSITEIQGAALGRDYQFILSQTLEINYATGAAEPKYTLVELTQI